MTATTHTNAAPALEMPAIPASLKRTAPPAAPKATPQVEALPGMTPLGVKESAQPVAKLSKREIKAARKEQVAAKQAKPTASAKKPHEPSKVVSTEANPSKSIVPPKYKTIYAAHEGTNGDNVAQALKAMETHNENGRPTIDWATMLEIAKANEIDLSAYEHLNAGQKRMNLGNKLRGAIKAGKTVVIGKKRIATLKAAEPMQQAA